MSVRTPLLRALHSALEVAIRDASPKRTLTRRTFLKSGAAALALTAFGGELFAKPYRSKLKPRIVIVGAGIAGLTAAYYLRKSGLHSTIYEGSSRSGGRIYTAHDL